MGSWHREVRRNERKLRSARNNRNSTTGRERPRDEDGKEGVMKCGKCGGSMSYENFWGQREDFFGWRCIFCGEIVDPIILENRLRQRG